MYERKKIIKECKVWGMQDMRAWKGITGETFVMATPLE